MSTQEAHQGYEQFGLYPFAKLQEIVSHLASANYADAEGRALIDADEFRELEQMAYEPPVPDPETQTVAGLLHHLETSQYTNSHGEELKSHPLIQILKLMNIRKAFIQRPGEILRLLKFLEDAGFQIATQNGVRELREDPALDTIRRILISGS